jgi:hypothetical protein
MKALLPGLCVLLCTLSCADESPAKVAEVPAALFVEAAPPGAVGVSEARAAATVGAEVVLKGMIGGRGRPFGASTATFVLVDPAITACPADEGCRTPWDCCCFPREQIAANSATVQLVDAAGQVLAAGLDGRHGLAPQAEVVVAGKVRAVDGGLLVDAQRIHVRR